jgi:hypothetical protein
MWEGWLHLPGVFDLAGPRGDGRLVAAVRGRLVLVTTSGTTNDFAPGYAVGDGPEEYIASSPGLAVEGASCQFPRDEVLALDLGNPLGVTKISPDGQVSHLATVAGVSGLTGIALDTEGRFGHRLLVVGPTAAGKTGVFAIDCSGAVQSIGEVATPLEGGIAVAPLDFGAYGGQLIAPDETGGSIYAVSPTGVLSTVVASGVPAGGDIGVESVGVVPATGADAAYLADRGTPGNPHPGTDSVLRLEGAALTGAGVRPGDLLVATEGGATVVDVSCRPTCGAQVVATGPADAHAEGRLLILARPPAPPVVPPAGRPLRTTSQSRWQLWVGAGLVLALGLALAAWLISRRRADRRTPFDVSVTPGDQGR